MAGIAQGEAVGVVAEFALEASELMDGWMDEGYMDYR